MTTRVRSGNGNEYLYSYRGEMLPMRKIHERSGCKVSLVTLQGRVKRYMNAENTQFHSLDECLFGTKITIAESNEQSRHARRDVAEYKGWMKYFKIGSLWKEARRMQSIPL